MNSDGWCFGIVTAGGEFLRVKSIIDSIEALNIPKDLYQIIIVGGINQCRSNYLHIDFDEGKKEGWITRKKNIIFKKSQFENISVTHDYVNYDINWYKNFIEFNSKNPDWDEIVCRVEDINGNRFRDWCQFRTDYKLEKDLWNKYAIQWLPYWDHTTTHLQYVSGAAYCIKKEFALKYPLDENKVWAESEDLSHALQVRDFWRLKCNPKSIYKFTKQKDLWPPKDKLWGWKPEYEKI